MKRFLLYDQNSIYIKNEYEHFISHFIHHCISPFLTCNWKIPTLMMFKNFSYFWVCMSLEPNELLD